MRGRWKRRLALVADSWLGRLAPVLLRGIAARPRPPHPRVLLIRCDHLGDAVMATAVLQPLRDALEPARLDVLAAPWAAQLFQHHPAVNRVISYGPSWWTAARGATLRARLGAWAALPGVIREIRSGQYDIGIDLRGDLRHILFFLVLGRIPERVGTDRTGGTRLLTHVWPYAPAAHEVEKNAAIVRLLGAQGPYALDIPDAGPLSGPLGQQLARASGPNGVVVLALGSNKPAHLWPARHAARLAELASDRLGLGTLFVGGARDRALADSIQALSRSPVRNLAGQTSVLESVALFRHAAAIVTVDAGPMHLAAASGTPLVALFGPTDPTVYGPWTATARVVAASPPCRCHDIACSLTRNTQGACMETIEPQRVLEALAQLLGAPL